MMRLCALLHFLGLLALVCLARPAQAVDHIVFNETNQIDDAFFGGLIPGDSVTFNGTVTTAGGPPGGISVFLPGAPTNLDLTFAEGSVTSAPDAVGVFFGGPSYSGNFVNHGSISGLLPAVDFVVGVFSGSFLNTGNLSSIGEIAVSFSGDVTGSIFNSGTIRGNAGGSIGSLNIFGGLETGASLTNTGLIEGLDNHGVVIGDDLEGSFVNYGTIRGLSPVGPAVGVLVGSDLDTTGNFMNAGLVEGFFEGVVIDGNLEGSFLNTGTITGGLVNGGYPVEIGDAVKIEGLLLGMFQNDGAIRGSDDGFDVDRNFGVGATFLNNGLIHGMNSGVDFGRFFHGVLTNHGTIIGLSTTDDGAAIEIERDLGPQGRIRNYGTLFGNEYGIAVFQGLHGEIFNCGIIEGVNFAGIRASFTDGTIRNHGGRITGRNFSIRLGGGDGTVVLSGPSHLQGQIGGGGGSDTIRFENMRGISSAKQAELAALAASDPSTGSVVLFGETISWQQFEDIQADLATLESYQDLITDPGLGGFAQALDNVLGLNDDFREYLKVLNDADASILNDLAANAAGQNLQNTLRDFGREQDTNFFHLFSNQFSSLRGDVSGQLVSNQGAVHNTGFLTQEVQVGAVAIDPGESSNMWMTSYVGSASQDANGSRAGADYDNTSILFGGGTEVAEGWYLGGFGGYTRNEGQIDGFGSYVENNGGWFGANAQYRSGDTFANFVAALGGQDVKSIRRDFQGNRFQGDTDSFGGFLYAQAGRDYFFNGSRGGAKVTPYLGFTLSSQSYDGFTETGGTASTALRFSDESISEFQSVLGVSVAGYHDLRGGWIRPRADLAWWHAFNGSNSYSAGLAAPGLLPGFTVSSPAANEDRGVFQVGMEFGCDRLEGWTFEAGYFGVLGSNDYDSHGGTFGARLDF